MKIFQNLMRSIRRQPDVLGAWLRDHLDRIAPSDGSAEPRFEEANRLLDELDVWAWAIYNDESDPTLWRKALERWRAQSSNEAIAEPYRRVRADHLDPLRSGEKAGGWLVGLLVVGGVGAPYFGKRSRSSYSRFRASRGDSSSGTISASRCSTALASAGPCPA